MKNNLYVQLTHDPIYGYEDITDSIIYYEEKLDYLMYTNLVNDIEELLSFKNKQLDEVESLMNFYKDKDEQIVKESLSEGYFCELFEEGYISRNSNLQTILHEILKDNDLTTFLYEVFNREELEEYIASLGLRFGTVGYSQWAYYLADDGLSYQYIEDLYNGYNFYFVELLNDEGEQLDSLSFCYINNDTDLKEVLIGFFGVDFEKENVYLVDNQETKYFKLFPKARKITYATYEFVAI